MSDGWSGDEEHFTAEPMDPAIDHVSAPIDAPSPEPSPKPIPEQSVDRSNHRNVFVGPVKIRVGSPQKVTEGASAFVAYLVTSERPGQDAEHVRRRFSDFVKLYDQLVAEYPGCAVPPLPDHSRLEYIAGDRFSEEFTSRRAVSLQRFLFRLTQHPELSRSRALAAFLTPRDLLGPRKPALRLNADSSVIDALSDTLLNVFAKVQHQSKEMIEAKDKADRLEHNIGTIDRAFARMTRHQADLVHDLSDVHRQASRLAGLEPGVAREFNQLAKAAKAIASATATLHTAMDATFAGALRDITHYVQAIKQLLKQREQRQIDFEALSDYLARTQNDLAAAQAGAGSTSFLRTKVNDLRGVDNEQARQSRLERLNSRVDTLTAEVTRAERISQQFEEVAKREVAIFEATEALELKACLGAIADSNISYYAKVLEECRAIEAEL